MGKERSVKLVIPYTPPLDWGFFLRYLTARATPGVERVEEGRYTRGIMIERAAGVLSVGHSSERHEVEVDVRGEASRHADVIRARVVRMFDLEADLEDVKRVLGRDPLLARLMKAAPGVRVPGAWSSFEVMMRAIVGQQVTVKAATTIMGRLAGRLGDAGDGVVHFPSAEAIAAADLAGLGMPGARVAALQGVARAVASGEAPLEGADDMRTALLKLAGIGPWTAEYVALRAAKDADAWPGTDLVLKRVVAEAVGSDLKKDHVARTEAWRPYRAYAAVHLWNSAASVPGAGKKTPRT